MKTVLLDGTPEDDATGTRVGQALAEVLKGRGHETEHVLLREKKIGNCAGDFFCWIRSPGICNVNDDNREIAKAVVQSELVIFLTPVRFGGYSSDLKAMVDHLIQNISPYFARVNGETHHQPRYSRYSDFLAIGYLDEPDERAEKVFRHLAWRNSLNFYPENARAGIVYAKQSDREIGSSVAGWLEEIETGCGLQPSKLPDFTPTQQKNGTPVKNALLLVGSPRTKKSTSFSLGSYLLEEMAEQGVQSRTIHIHTSLAEERMKSLLEATDSADLIVLAFPLYVDSLPAPVILALELIEAHRKGRHDTRQPLFVAIANSGFPEAHHNDTALAICNTFALQAGFVSAGTLALGGGEIVHGIPLDEAGGKARPIRKSLTLAAAALVQGLPVPEEARHLLAKPLIPAWLYRLVGGFSWKPQARRFGVQRGLRNRPYALESRAP